MSTLVLLDLSKVFDSLNHTILLPKLMSSARVYCSTLKYLHKRENKMNIYLAHGKIHKITLVLNIVMQSWSSKTLRNVRLSSLIC